MNQIILLVYLYIQNGGSIFSNGTELERETYSNHLQY